MRAGGKRGKRAKKAGGGARAGARSERAPQAPPPADGALQPPSEAPSAGAPPPPEQTAQYTPPLAEQTAQYTPAADLPVQSEEKFKLPSAPPAALDGVRRRRRRRPGAAAEEEGAASRAEPGAAPSPLGVGGQDPQASQQDFSAEAVRKLTEEFRKGNSDAEKSLISQMEKDPDFVFQAGGAPGEYDLADALMGTGKPNKQGIYVLPYLQSGHVLLLLVIVLCAFVYYPGFPLTELDVGVTNFLKRGLGITFAFNSVVAFFAYREAKKRDQPPLFWAFKTALLGGLAFSELRNNAAVKSGNAER